MAAAGIEIDEINFLSQMFYPSVTGCNASRV